MLRSSRWIASQSDGSSFGSRLSVFRGSIGADMLVPEVRPCNRVQWDLQGVRKGGLSDREGRTARCSQPPPQYFLSTCLWRARSSATLRW